MKSLADLSIIFYGTPEFAVASLKALVDAGANVIAVVTAPDKPAGRGMQLRAPEVKQYALEAGLKVLQPEKLKAPEFIKELKALGPDLQVVVAFRMLPEMVWNMPPMGTINVHASLLPQYRGAAPINHAIMNGEVETGVTTFKLKHEIDTGNILLQEKVAILPEDNYGTLYEKLMRAGGALLVETVKGIAEGNIREIQQDNVPLPELKHAPKLFREDLRIDWNMPVKKIHDHIRGLAPYPAAAAVLADKSIKIYITHYIMETHNETPGAYDTDHKKWLRMAAPDGWLYIDELQQEGKKRMIIEDFLRGFRG